MHIQFQSVNLIGKEHLVDLGVAVNVILKSILNKQCVCVCVYV